MDFQAFMSQKLGPAWVVSPNPTAPNQISHARLLELRDQFERMTGRTTSEPLPLPERYASDASRSADVQV